MDKDKDLKNVREIALKNAKMISLQNGLGLIFRLEFIASMSKSRTLFGTLLIGVNGRVCETFGYRNHRLTGFSIF